MSDAPQIIPKGKMDLSIESGLNHASNEQILENLDELFEWTKDINWPVSSLIFNRISKLGSHLTNPVSEILSGDDFEWKGTIINFLLPLLSSSTINEIKLALIRIVEFPTDIETNNELDKEVMVFLTSKDPYS